MLYRLVGRVHHCLDPDLASRFEGPVYTCLYQAVPHAVPAGVATAVPAVLQELVAARLPAQLHGSLP